MCAEVVVDSDVMALTTWLPKTIYVCMMVPRGNFIMIIWRWPRKVCLTHWPDPMAVILSLPCYSVQVHEELKEIKSNQKSIILFEAKTNKTKCQNKAIKLRV